MERIMVSGMVAGMGAGTTLTLTWRGLTGEAEVERSSGKAQSEDDTVSITWTVVRRCIA